MPDRLALTADAQPISHDRLLANALLDAFHAYLCGEYHVAYERFLDAQAISRHRADSVPLIALATTLGGMLDNGTLVAHPAVHAAAPAVRA